MRQLFLQEDRATDQTLIFPVRRGVALDTLRRARKPGGLVAVVECPDDLTSGKDPFKLDDNEATQQWVESVLAEFDARHGLLQ